MRWNFDIVMGISAVLLLFYIRVLGKQVSVIVMRAWNIIGLGFLGFIVVVALLSAPLPIQQLAFDQPNIAVSMFPFCWLPTCIVPIVFWTHVQGIRSEAKC